MKFLIAGLGNPGEEYANTRHNVGFLIVNQFVKAAEGSFESGRYADVASVRLKGKTCIVIKPTTYMNLSGNAVRYYMQQEKIEISNVIVVVDDIALPFGAIRLRGSGSDAGHNGLRNIQEVLSSNAYPRLRFGIGSDFSKGKQSDYVLGKWTAEEEKTLAERITLACDAVKAFVLAGLPRAMNDYNKR